MYLSFPTAGNRKPQTQCKRAPRRAQLQIRCPGGLRTACNGVFCAKVMYCATIKDCKHSYSKQAIPTSALSLPIAPQKAQRPKKLQLLFSMPGVERHLPVELVCPKQFVEFLVLLRMQVKRRPSQSRSQQSCSLCLSVCPSFTSPSHSA